MTYSETLAASNQTRLDVTEQIQRIHQIYGGSDNTQQGGLAASKSLNYAQAPTMQRALPVTATVIPFTFHFVNQVGLFGAENMYVKVSIDIQSAPINEPIINNYEAAQLYYPSEPIENTYEQAVLDPQNYITVNTYEQAEISDDFPAFTNPKVKVDVKNLKTGNIYIDTWLDVMLYKKDGEMWPFDIIYLNPKDEFYLGFHARNTRHLPFNVDCTIGEEVVEASTLRAEEYIAYYN